MFDVSEKATEKIKELFGQHKAAWSGQTLTMVLDEPRNGDKVFNRNGIIFVIAQEFFDQVKLIAVDYIAFSSSSEFSISLVAYNFSLFEHIMWVSVFVGGNSIVNCEKPFPGCRLFGMMVHLTAYAKKARF